MREGRREGADGDRWVTLPVQQKDLASFLGARPETLSKRMRALVRLQTHGVWSTVVRSCVR